MRIINIAGLVLLFVSIIFTGRQLGIYLRMRRRNGKVVSELSPSKGQKKILMGAGIIFIILLVFVTYSYVAQGIQLSVTFIAIIAVVIYSTGRFSSKITELREEGMILHLNEVAYSEIKSYKIEERKSRGALTLMFKDDREFITLISLSEIEGIKATLQKKL